MQRTLNNLLTIVVIGLVMATASMSLAKGGGHGGGHSGGHSSHASHSHASRGNTASGHSHHTSSNHKNANKTNKTKKTNGKKNKKTKKTNGKKTSSKKNKNNKKNKKNKKNKHRKHHRRYPSGFWFGGGDDGDGGGDDGDSVDVPAEFETAAVSPTGVDVSFASIRQLDAGDPDNNLGPSYRVWITNNSPVAIDTPFDVALLASTDGKMSQGLPFGSVQVENIEAGETQALDIRLPVAAMTMDGQGDDAGAYSFVHAVVDSQNVLVESNKKNNIAVFNDDDIPQVDE